MTKMIRNVLANTPYLVLLALAVIVPALLTNQYYIQVLSFIGIYIILALSLNLLNGFVGLLSIGHGNDKR